EPTVGTDADVAEGAIATPTASPRRTVEPESRWVLERIDEFQGRLQERARQVNLDLARIDYDEIDEPDGIVTTEALIDSLRKAGRFSYDQIKCIGKPAHLAKLSDPDLSLFIERAMQRHSDARGRTKQSVIYQSHQLHMIRNAYAELCVRLQSGRM
ncbi:MAG: hypothetical protein LC799_36100, partial [Actinobacteria bacterium]|nr:hypothetical protein [Actinomycetota bacterium]